MFTSAVQAASQFEAAMKVVSAAFADAAAAARRAGDLLREFRRRDDEEWRANWYRHPEDAWWE